MSSGSEVIWLVFQHKCSQGLGRFIWRKDIIYVNRRHNSGRNPMPYPSGYGRICGRIAGRI